MLESLNIHQEEGEGDLSCLGSYYRREIDCIFPDFYLNYRFPNSQHAIWSPLQSLLSRLSKLRDMTWSCVELFPPCLLDTLHRFIPHCRLHITIFILPSLRYKNDVPSHVDEYEYKLATSPSLSSILVPLPKVDSEWAVCLNAKAAIHLATGLAPNLSRVHIVEDPSELRLNPAEPGCPEWKGFPQNLNDEHRLHGGSLRYLSLSSVRLGYFKAWENQNAFFGLRVLQLWDVSECVLIAATSCQFHLLRSLALSFPGWESYDRAASDFVSSLHLLETIRMSSCQKEHTFQATLRHHGKSLTELSLLPRASDSGEEVPSFTNRIIQIRLHCPNIRSLQFSVYRRRLKEEDSLFRAIGEIPHLRDISLRLICNDDMQEQESFLNSLDYSTSAPELSRAMLQNSPLHSSLPAQAIFFTVAQESFLQRLTLDIRCTLCPKRVAGFLNWTCCRWRCERVSGNRIIVRELEKDDDCKDEQPTIHL
ncbi:hypothetical protein PEX1_094840 [Penicillium expansum]|nr:hypothetical protein PEXP_043890 [Penicillium expansum]KGO56053.1 hypothetical protein PEX1_094840 [Penicillium expansum]